MYRAAIAHGTLVQFITSAIIKSHNQIQANILYKETDRKWLHQRNLIILGLLGMVLRDMCTDNSTIIFILLCVYVVNIPEPVQYNYDICTGCTL